MHASKFFVELCADCSHGHVIHVCICNSVHFRAIFITVQGSCRQLMLTDCCLYRHTFCAAQQALKPDKFAFTVLSVLICHVAGVMHLG